MKKLAISFITFNRAKHIKEDLENITKLASDYLIDIYIYDGSTNRHTEYVVKKYVDDGNNHIHYLHLNSNMSTRDNLTLRLDKALLAPNAEYIWLCGDKFVVKPKYYSEILSYIDRSYDIITIYGRILRGTKKFDNPSDFVDYAIVPITQFGSTIIKKELIESFSIKKFRNKLPAFGIQLMYLKAIEEKSLFKGVVIDAGGQVNILTHYETKSDSLSCMWDTWIVNWYKFIHALPSTYDSIRDGLYNRPDQQMGFFSSKELFRQRSEGQFDWKKYMKCRKYVKKVIVMPNILVFSIAILPKNIAKWLYNHMR